MNRQKKLILSKGIKKENKEIFSQNIGLIGGVGVNTINKEVKGRTAK